MLEQRGLRRKTYAAVSIMADGGYDGREVFSECKKIDIKASIRIRRNANCKADGVDGARTEAVLDQLADGPDVTPAEFAATGEKRRGRAAKNGSGASGTACGGL